MIQIGKQFEKENKYLEKIEKIEKVRTEKQN